ncbi:MAG TPA: efflux RND transporter periplasmic adaptor subunit, partial [Ignavibacteriaceae bacterium]|nr:efflux RND transporter periplasmic adaptor subunit [Ignavibacteriaceae bacterium]
MKKIIIVIIISIATGVGAGWLIFGTHSSTQKEDGKRKILFYRNPMNPMVTSPVFKKDEMGMDYVPVYADENQSSNGERKILYYRSPMNPQQTSTVPKKDEMGMDYVPVYEDQAGSNTVHIDPATQQNIGVTTETVTKRNLQRNIRTTGNITYDETRLYTINSKIMGYIEKLFVDYTGQPVKKGQPLLEIYSPDLVSTQEEYLQAIKYRKEISGGSAISINGADQMIESARRRLSNWDISDKDIKALENRGTPEKTMTLYSPADGIVTDKMAINGQNIMPGMVLYKIADLSTVWCIAQIYQYELQWIKSGDKADIKLSYLPGKSFQGKITYVYPYLDEDTKTARVRIEIKNTQNYEFKPGMFANVSIKSPLNAYVNAVPEQAIIHTGTRDVAIIALGNGYFKPVNVTLGARGDNGYVQIIDGLNEGDKIVTSSQFLIDSESNLNAALNNMAQTDSANQNHD